MAQRTVSTTKETADLIVGSIVVDAFAATCIKVTDDPFPYNWRRVTPAVDNAKSRPHGPFLPATVVYEPGDEQ